MKKQLDGIYFGRKMTDYTGSLGGFAITILVFGLLGSTVILLAGQMQLAFGSAVGVLAIFFLCWALDKIIRILMDIRHILINRQTVAMPQQFACSQNPQGVQSHSVPVKPDFKVNIPDIDK